MKPNPSLVGSRIRRNRKEKGLTMVELGKMINAPQSAISNWEKGDNLPNNERLAKLSTIFNVTVDELLYGIRADEMEQLKIALSDMKKTNEHTEYFNVSPETEAELLQKVNHALTDFYKPDAKITKDNFRKFIITTVFLKHYYETHVTNISAIRKVEKELSNVANNINKYFETVVFYPDFYDEVSTLIIHHENLNKKLGERLSEIFETALKSLALLEKQYLNESVDETITIVLNQESSIEKMTFEEFTLKIGLLFSIALQEKHPELSESEITELAKQKLSQHHEYILDFYNSNYSS